ncbi:transposase [Symbiopectobacterium sp. RP]|uniref:transposase n=1 Tax=Symbiopectobacterium sp. RP TaxID=3248553 RepID=UPI003D2DBC29
MILRCEDLSFHWGCSIKSIYSTKPPKGQRCFDLKNGGAKGRTNVIGTLLGTTLFAIGLFDININSNVFYSWVTQVLIPVLPKNSVIVMDNATFYKKHGFV